MASSSEIAKTVTIYDVAAQMGVSSGTVWKSLHNHGRVSQETRKRVLEKAQEMGYRPSMVAQTLIRKKTCLIGVVVPMIGNSSYSPIVRGVESRACEKDYNIILCDTDINLDKERRYVDMLIRRRVEGIVVIPFANRSREDYHHLEEARKLGIHVIIVDHYTPDEGISRVVTDEFSDAFTMTNHLIGLGHRRIGFCHCGLPEWSGSDIQKFQGYRQSLTDSNIAYDESLVLECGTLTIDEQKSTFPDRIFDYLKRPNRPSAIVAYTDMLAIKIMAQARKIGLRIPEDIAIVGFGNVLMSEYAVPPLTTVTHPGERVGSRAAELLFEQISEKSKQQESPVYERIAGELIVRESCGSKLHL